VDASASTGLGLGYSWTSSPAGFTSAIANPTVSPTVTTTYTVVITDRFGCTSNANLTITVDALPVAKAGSDQTICSGNNTSIDGSTSTGSDLSYSWASSPAGFTSAVANPSVSPTVTTTYTLTTTDKHGCTANDDVVITVNAGAIASITVNPSICEGEKILLTGTATNGSSFLWSTAGDGGFNNTSTINPEYTPGSNDISSGSVNITITVQGNAPCPAASDSKTITINPKPNTSSIFHF
jgi:hypothetical protein